MQLHKISESIVRYIDFLEFEEMNNYSKFWMRILYAIGLFGSIGVSIYILNWHAKKKQKEEDEAVEYAEKK